MTENQTNRDLSAYDIYRSDFKTLGKSLNLYPSKAYFISLEKAVINDLETQGFCVLADRLIESDSKSIDVLTVAVFMDIERGYQNGNYADITEQGQYCDLIPHIELTTGSAFSGYKKEHIAWIQYNSLGSRKLNYTDEIRQMINRVRTMIRASHLDRVKNMEESIRREYAEQGSSILRNSEKSAQITENKAAEKARSLIDQATHESERIRAEAQTAANRIREEAKAASDIIREEAEDTARRMKAEIDAKAKQSSKEQVEQLIEQYLEENQRKMRTESNAEAGRMIAQELARRHSMASVYDDMCERANSIQASWINSLNQSIEQLEGIKSDFYRHLHDWQASLYQTDIRPIAERYLELYRIINVDRLIRTEIISRDKEKSNGETEDPIIAGLERINRTLTIFLRRFETSLNGLDMYVYYPQAGDEYNDLKHVSEDDEEPSSNARVAECVLPGIARKSSDDQDDESMDDVVIRAVVKVEKTENESI